MPKIEPLLTVADLDSLPDDGNRYELIEGGLFVSRAPGLKHQLVVHNSPGKANEDRDRVAKRQLYGAHGVAEYWIADPERRAVEVYRLGDAGLALEAALGLDGELTTPLLPGLKLPLAAVFDFSGLAPLG